MQLRKLGSKLDGSEVIATSNALGSFLCCGSLRRFAETNTVAFTNSLWKSSDAKFSWSVSKGVQAGDRKGPDPFYVTSPTEFVPCIVC